MASEFGSISSVGDVLHTNSEQRLNGHGSGSWTLAASSS